MDRRDFLKASMLTLVSGVGGPGFLSRTALAALGPGKTLVVVQLSGGNDGLNTLVPYTNGAYYAARPSIAIGKTDVLPVSADVGFNPSLKPLMKLWDAGEVAVVQGVGYPNANRSHFESMAIWHSANPNLDANRDGWIGRIAEKYGDPFCATNFRSSTPLALRTSDVVLPSIASVDSFQIKFPEPINKVFTEFINRPADARENNRAERVRMVTKQMLENTATVQAKVKKYKPGSAYPEKEGFASSLRDISRMIAGEVGPRVFYTQLGGFDNHAGQLNDHPKLLEVLSNALTAFRADLEAQGKADDVTVLVFSEFGRRVTENASAGTDHGQAGLMFVLGKKVKGGLYGAYPDLEKLENGDLKFNTDFRAVYATALDRWLNIPSKDILGASFPSMGFLN
jgi:uncharacterized protein (DUF1501 family)